jgi:hypothetical protein
MGGASVTATLWAHFGEEKSIEEVCFSSDLYRVSTICFVLF